MSSSQLRLALADKAYHAARAALACVPSRPLAHAGGLLAALAPALASFENFRDACAGAQAAGDLPRAAAVCGYTGQLGARALHAAAEAGLAPVPVPRAALGLPPSALALAAIEAAGGAAPCAWLLCQGLTGASGPLGAYLEANALSHCACALAARALGAQAASAGTLSLFVSAWETPLGPALSQKARACLPCDSPENFHLAGAYAQSKWIGELLCSAAGAHTLRLGLLAPPDPKPGEFLQTAAEALAAAGCRPDLPPRKFDMTCPDAAAAALLALCRPGAQALAHFASPKPASAADLAGALEACGLPLPLCSEDEFLRRLRSAGLPALAQTIALRLFREPPALPKTFNFDLCQAGSLDFCPSPFLPAQPQEFPQAALLRRARLALQGRAP